MRSTENLFVAGFANGVVKIIQPSGQILCELSAHQKGLNALVCHPSKPFFATCSDDTFVHVFAVTGNAADKIDVNLHLGSRVNNL